MAGASLLALIDDIATLLDDVSVLSKVAVQKTSGVLGDDLALNAQQVTGLSPDRELPVVWQVAKGSAVNKAILVPAALSISAIMPSAIAPLLMIGGVYLCFEGVEKLVHHYLHPKEDEAEHAERAEAVQNPSIDMVAFEKDRIAGAVRTDFVLSAEIIVITLGTLQKTEFLRQVFVLVAVSAIMTIGVYGLVAAIVKLDDLGLRLVKSPRSWTASVGRAILASAPYLLKFLSVAGTVAMFLVGGGIISHGLPIIHDWIHHVSESIHGVPVVGGLFSTQASLTLDGLVGVAAGAMALAVVLVVKQFWSRKSPSAH